MKRFLFYTVLIIPLHSAAQSSLSSDTIKIPGVVISSVASGYTPSAYKVIKTDSALLKSYYYESVADVIALSSPLFIKTYGTGGIATPSFRGTGASNTLVTWNGIRIDHPMLGQTDLSLLPAGFTDELNIYYGGASMQLYSGAPGGLISLETRPVWEKMSSVTLTPGTGSFGKYSGSVIIKTGSGKFHSSTKAFYQKAENNFPFINTVSGPEPVREIRKNSEIRQEGFIQELYYRGKSGVLAARFWYQNADRNLPAPIIAQTPGQIEKQNDESIRTLLNYDTGIRKSRLSFTGAWIMNRLDYFNKIASINSKNKSDMIVFKADINHPVGQKFKLGIGMNEELTTVISNNYESAAKRNSANITLMLSDNGSSRLGGNLLFREILHGNKFLVPDFSSGIKYKLSATKEYILSANFSRTSRIPSMNDMFWYPGGNKDLRNENAFVYELNYRMKDRISSSVAFDYSLSAYRNSIHDMIQWRPGEYSYWTAINIREVRSSGVETSISASYKKNKFGSVLTTGYSFTKAYDDEPGGERRQLMYVPEHLSNTLFTISYGKLHSSWNMTVNGKRYVTADNSRSLPSYAVHRLSTGVRLNPAWGIMDLGIDIDNVFNTGYETVAYYPLPGRSYFFKMLLQIKSEK